MTFSANTFSNIGGAVSDIFAAKGAGIQADYYKKAATLAEQSAAITKESTAIQLTQAQRQIFQVIGGQQAQVAGAGFAESGTALDLLASSRSQGALQKQIIANQGLITEAGYEAQAQAYQGQAAAAQSAKKGSIFSSLFKIGAAILPFVL